MSRSRDSLTLVLGVLGVASLLHCSGSGAPAVQPLDAGSDPPGTDASQDAGGDDGTSADVRDEGSESRDAGGIDATDGGGADAGDASDGHDAGMSCDATHPCPGVLSCCAGRCADTSHDPSNCGMCGHACGGAQFCTGTTCDDAVLLNLCANPSATVVFDPYAPDNGAGTTVGASLAAICPESVRQVQQGDAGILEADSGRPITGPGDTFVVGGGGYGQAGWAYLDTMALTAVYPGTDGTSVWVQNRKTQTPIVTTLIANLTAHHDYFYVELVVEPASGTLCFGAVGLLAPGTAAAGYWVANQVVPNRASYADAWYVYEWTDTNDDSVPDAGDTFTLVAHGR